MHQNTYHIDSYPGAKRIALYDEYNRTCAVFGTVPDALSHAASLDLELKPHTLTRSRLESFRGGDITPAERKWATRELRKQHGSTEFPIGRADKQLCLRRLEDGDTAILDTSDDTVITRDRFLTDAVMRLVKACHENVRMNEETLRLLLNARTTIHQRKRQKRVDAFEAWFAPLNPRQPTHDVHVLYKHDGRWVVSDDESNAGETYLTLQDAVTALAENQTRLVRMSRHVAADVRDVLRRLDPSHKGYLWAWYRSATRRWRETMHVSMYEAEKRGTTRTKTRL